MKNNKSKKVAAVIACRVNSTRLFGKPLQKIGEYSILEHLINQIRKSKIISEIVLAISKNPGNEIFIDFAKKHKLKFVLGDEKDVLKRLIQGARAVNADIVFRTTSENPFIFWEGIDTVLRKHISRKYDFSLVYPLPLGSGFEVINRSALEISHRHGTKRHRSEYCDMYINENKDKFKIYIFKPEKKLQKPQFRLTVDTPQDLIVVRKIYDKLGKKNNPISLRKIVKFLDNNPDIVKINSNIEMKHVYGEEFLE